MPQLKKKNSVTATPNSAAVLVRRWAPWILAGQIVVSILLAVISKYPWLDYVRDDFFYYLIVAQNFAAGHGSTFNGIVPTNGYHPLWMLVLAGLSLFTHNTTAILVSVGIVCLVATLVCFLSLRDILEICGTDIFLSTALALWAAVFCSRKFYTGMEVVLATPLMCLLALRVMKGGAMATVRDALLTGALCSLLMLSRLDTGIFLVLLGISFLCVRVGREQVNAKTFAAFFAGLIPIFVYFAINKAAFGVLIPISGLAKELKPHSQFSIVTWRYVLLGRKLLTPEHLQTYFVLFTAVVVLVCWRRLRNFERIVFPAVLLFPLVYYTALSFLSDWTPNDWYLYAVRPGLGISFAFWLNCGFFRRLNRSLVIRGIAGTAAVAALAMNFWHAQPDGRYKDALAFQKFAEAHPGKYAIGDFGGEVAYLLGRPVVQTEGLVMDKTFLQNIKERRNLLDVLRQHNVDYYIANTRQGYTGCFHAVEPLEGGPASDKMEADFCSKPVYESSHTDNHFVIFDMSRERKAVLE